MTLAISAQLASVGYKISIEKDWIVVIAGKSESFLASKQRQRELRSLG